MAYVHSVQGIGDVMLDAQEVDRIERAQVALLLHITPDEVDNMPAQDVSDVLEIHSANNEIQNWQNKQKR
tara:strand:+ start:717 stop:926 length:210 start_codon:yes stop_codon:yes gene_type:complete